MSASLGALAPIAARKALEVEQLRCAAAGIWAKAATLPPARPLAPALRDGAVIAEMKRRSPSGGLLRESLQPAALAPAYKASGAAAISVLTDGPDFGGSLQDLQDVRDAVDLPLLRKDFTLDATQVAEARVAGADWVLLIVALLDAHALDDLLAAVRTTRAHVIVEVHSAEEARMAVDAGAECIGVNNRDLRTLTTDLGAFAKIRPLVPHSITCIAESGVRTPHDAARLVSEGADSVLVGEALMRAASPAALCAEIVAAARAAASR